MKMKKAFTLVELVVAVALLVMVFSLSAKLLRREQQKKRDARSESEQ